MAGSRKYTERDNPRELFKNLYAKATALGLSEKDWKKLDALRDIRKGTAKKPFVVRVVEKVCLFTLILCAVLLFIIVTEWPVSNNKLLFVWFKVQDLDPYHEQCLVEMSESISDYVRPPVDCSFCEGVTQIDRITNITREQFEAKYAYSGRPVVVEGSTANWTAMNVFSFKFFKKIYSEDSPSLVNSDTNCQFFPYATSFENLGEVFNMSEERALMKDGFEPWYIGWGNCDFSAANILRKHYHRPEFLPVDSESSKTDWIFMGSPGHGAYLHIDNVDLMSWQAQITSSKRWLLEPPPECYYKCVHSMSTVVSPGEIIIVDTNKWYHSTLVVGKDVSICIGSEYD
ncbi:uncharacterized protein LOC117337499 [Pecten maximus]|uniref:uncharacterized protein LOC117337499 n=1 Tax=Pecten maximus TaxID=6579 RepID=UPI0014584760|nr:uncharacterized protein LOC117337499 [Pecten maximus]XP_033754399.1 uncharacterized protein LOC117337499 [Pecten maximus]